jgi:tetratricopeptide (TPR) repeat protein
VEFRVLGPLQVQAAGEVINTGHSRQSAVLAVLLLDLGRVIPTRVLIDRVWGEDPPASVHNVLYSYVARLRTVMAGVVDPDVTLARGHGGYLLQARPDQVDLSRFRRLIVEATQAPGNDERSAGLLQQALALWRGPALAGTESPWLNTMCRMLESERFAAELDLNEIRLRRGEHALLARELASQAAVMPADERLTGQLMLALWRSGRPAEALRSFEQARNYLARELGADPGPQLQALHQQILRGDDALAWPANGSHLRVPVPRELPADVPAFTGRAGELTALTRLLDQTDEQAPGTVLISAIGGTAGVGKTALAVHWAHQVAGRFPGGQLYVNLRGYDLGQPMHAADALAGFLRALGVAGQDIPVEVEERAARFRSLLAGRRMLVVLDNAGSVEQVRPLLPGTPGCVAVVTSRDSLVGLVARYGAPRLDLDLLPLEDAIGLLRELIGGRVDADSVTAAALAAQCSRLPLALRVAAELAAGRPTDSLAGLAGELADQQRRLDLLDADGDPRTALRAVFSWSYRHLSTDAARAFRLAGLHPGPHLDPYATAALVGASVERARQLLDQLGRAYLIHPIRSGRSGMHDLLRAYAAEQAIKHDAEPDRRAALTRLFDHYLHTAAAAMDTLFPAERHRRPCIPRPASPGPPVAEPHAARAWLDAERASLTAIAAHTAAHGWPDHTTRLAAILYRYLEAGGHYADAVTIHGHAQTAAQHAGDSAAEATTLISLGLVDVRQGRYPQAAGQFQQALAFFRQTGDQRGAARALTNAGNLDARQGRYPQAADYLQQALALFRQTGDRTGEAYALGNLGDVERRQGRYPQAADHLQQALALFRQTGDRTGEANTLGNLGCVYERQGRYPQAADHLQQALALFRQTGDRTGEANTLGNLGCVYQRQASCQQAADHLQQALTLFRQTGDRSGEAEALNGLGEVFLAIGQPGHARTQHNIAVGLADQIGDQEQQARAHNGLAHAYHADNDAGQARHHWQQALTIYTGIGAPEADEVRIQLTKADGLRQHEP